MNAPAQKKLSNWLDLSPVDAQLTALKFPDGKIRIVLSGFAPGAADWNWAISTQGFKPSRSNTFLYRDGAVLQFPPFLARFPQARVVQMPINRIIQMVSPDNIRGERSAAQKRVEIDAKTVRNLGYNHLGQIVCEGATGRYIQTGQDAPVLPEGDSRSPALFLRATNDDELALCADGFVERMVRGQVLHSEDLRAFGATVFSEAKSLEAHDLRLRQVQEAVEAAMQRRLEREMGAPDASAYELAVMLTERQPAFIYRTSSSIENQQYSTPLPMAVAAQHMLNAQPGDRVVEPTIGNGSLVSALPAGVEIHGVEIDDRRAAQVRRLRDGLEIKVGDFVGMHFEEPFDRTIANPPFGGLKQAVEEEGLRITRIDHLILMRTLQARKPDGRSVFIIAADRSNVMDKNAGEIQGGSKYLFNWLADHYELDSVVEMDGKLYEKQGSGYPVRIVVVGPRRSVAETQRAMQTEEYRLKGRLPVIRSWEDLWEHAEQLRRRAIEREASRRPVEPVSEQSRPALGTSSEPAQPFRVDSFFAPDGKRFVVVRGDGSVEQEFFGATAERRAKARAAELNETSHAEALQQPDEFEHNGTRIYPIKVRVGDQVETMWGVESAENRAKRIAGERHGFGDSLHDTPEQARAAADSEHRDVVQRAEWQRQDDEARARQEAEDAARKADTVNGFTVGKTPMQAGKIGESLSKQYRFEQGVRSVREHIEALHEAGELEVSTFEESRIKPMSRVQFNRATQREQDAHEKKMREAGNKTVYLVSGSDLGKTAYEYAQHLLQSKPTDLGMAARNDAVAQVEEAIDDLHSATAEVKEPGTLDELIGAIDAGYRAHFDYAGASGVTLWIEQTPKGWELKTVDDDRPNVRMTKGGPVLPGWSKLDALKAVEREAEYRFKEWKQLAAPEQSQVPNLVQAKRDQVLAGQTAIMSDQEMDDWIDDGMPGDVVSMPNPNQVGTIDQWQVGLKSNPDIKAARVAAGIEPAAPEDGEEVGKRLAEFSYTAYFDPDDGAGKKFRQGIIKAESEEAAKETVHGMDWMVRPYSVEVDALLAEQRLPPKAEDYPDAGSYHAAVRAYREEHPVERQPEDSLDEIARIDRKISNAQERLRKKQREVANPGATPVVILQDAARSIEVEIDRLRLERERIVGERESGRVEGGNEHRASEPQRAEIGAPEGASAGRNEPAPSVAVVAPQVSHQRVENHFQAPYNPASKIGEATAMVPRNLVAPISEALDELEFEYGTVDEYVARKLQYEVDDLDEYFSPEQVDAIALAIAAADKGRALINGDQTGQGKGRVVAAMARYAVLQGWPVMFMTEKANLFSDLWRDIEDIGSTALFKPFMVNDGVEIRSQDNRRAVSPSRKKDIDPLIEGFMSPHDAGYNLTFTTYSQLNRAADSSKKSHWLVECAARDAFLILDESHNAAGLSNTGENVAIAIQNAHSAMYSSATYAKTAKNMRAYAKAFPEGVCDENLADTLAVGGEPLQEILSGMLARDGVFVRREHDLSRLEFITHKDLAHKARNEVFSDQLSEILLAMSYLSGDVDKMVARLQKEIKDHLAKLNAEQRKGNRMNVSRANFGSRLYALQRQALLTMKVDEAIDCAVRALETGRKPVVVLEQTQEALVREVIAQTLSLAEDEEEYEDEVEATKRLSAALGSSTEIPLITFKDVLLRTLERLDVITERNAYGVASKTTAAAKAKNEDEVRSWEGAKKNIRAMIAALPDLPCSPIDLIRQRLEDRGFTCGELTGRSIQLTVLDDKMVVMPRIDNRLETIHGFQNGGLDAVIVSRAGSTGISLHASDKCDDQRQRELIELEIALDVNARVQFFGRVNRRGQTSSPVIRTISSELPSEARVLAMQNAKLRKLSANTQSDRENAAESKEVVDVINHIGDEICKKFLENNPDIARMLDIEVSEAEEGAGQEAYFANKLMGRLGLLRFREQERILSEIAAEYEATMLDLERLGVNPFKANEYDWNARVVSRELFHGTEQETYASEFDKPVYLTLLEWEEDRQPLRWADVEQMVGRSFESLASDGRCTTQQFGSEVRVSYGPLLQIVRERFNGTPEKRGLKEMSLPRGFDTVRDALDAAEDNPVKRLQKRQDYLELVLRWIKPGEMVAFRDEGDAMVKGKIVGFDLPVKGREHLLAQYQVRIAVPGEDAPIIFTLARLQELGMERVYSLDPSASWSSTGAASYFDSAPAGKVALQRFVLEGNLFKAAQIAAEQSLGMAGIYTNEKGERQRGIVLWKRVDAKEIKSVPVKVERKELAQALIEKFKGLPFHTTPSSDDKEGLRLILEPTGRVAVSVHGSKSHGGSWYLDKKITAITGEFAGGRDLMRAAFPQERLGEFMDVVYQRGAAFYVPASKREELNSLMQTALLDVLGKSAAPAAAAGRRGEMAVA